jgi:hypothetical protein
MRLVAAVADTVAAFMVVVVAAAFMVVEASTAVEAFMVAEAFTVAAFTVVDSTVGAFIVEDFVAAVFMPFALLRGRDAVTAQAASNPTPPVPATRTFRKAWSRTA